MQARALIMLAVAVVLGVIAVILVNTLLSQKVEQRTAVETVTTTPVVVAAVDLPVGTRLETGMLKKADWPQASRPEGTFDDPAKVVGDTPSEAPVVLREVRIGEPVLKYKLSPYGARGGLTVRIPEGYRAMTMDTNEVKGVAGFVLPGDSVDLLHTSNEFRKDNKPVTHLLLQRVKVLAVDQASSEKEDKPQVANAVTVLVTAEQGEKITLARRTGEVSLMLRNETDEGVSPAKLISIEDLRVLEVAMVKPQPTVSKPVVRQSTSGYSGASVTVIKGLSVSSQSVKKEPAPSAAQETSKSKQAGS